MLEQRRESSFESYPKRVDGTDRNCHNRDVQLRSFSIMITRQQALKARQPATRQANSNKTAILSDGDISQRLTPTSNVVCVSKVILQRVPQMIAGYAIVSWPAQHFKHLKPSRSASRWSSQITRCTAMSKHSHQLRRSDAPKSLARILQLRSLESGQRPQVVKYERSNNGGD